MTASRHDRRVAHSVWERLCLIHEEWNAEWGKASRSEPHRLHEIDLAGRSVRIIENALTRERRGRGVYGHTQITMNPNGTALVCTGSHEEAVYDDRGDRIGVQTVRHESVWTVSQVRNAEHFAKHCCASRKVEYPAGSSNCPCIACEVAMAAQRAPKPPATADRGTRVCSVHLGPREENTRARRRKAQRERMGSR